MDDYKEIWFEQLSSTNEYSMTNIANLEDKNIVIAETQNDGYGRFKRKWVSDKPDNLYASIILKPACELNENLPISNITQYMSVIICEILAEYNIKAEIKWPNDVLVDGKKIAGLLSEASIQGNQLKGFVLGVGINLNLEKSDIEEIDQPATSLNLETGNNTDKNEFSQKLFKAFFAEYDNFIKSGFEFIKNRYISRCSFIGKEIFIKNLDTQQKGIAKSINNDGSLLLQENNNQSTIRIGDLVCQ